MAKLAVILKDEILRLARKEVRQETERLKKGMAAAKAEVVALKRRIEGLERQQASAAKRAAKGLPVPAEGDESPRLRFRAKGFAAHRARLGLSAAEMGALVGVSAQTIYNWEAGKTRPRGNQIEAVAAVRNMGKRQVKAKLAEPATEEAEG